MISFRVCKISLPCVLVSALSLAFCGSAGAVPPPAHDAAHGGIPAQSSRPVDMSHVPQEAFGQDAGCITCHANIENATENMGFELSCVFCHGGDPDATTIKTAHVLPTLPVIMDNTVPPLDYDLPYQRFLNPTNLRVVNDTCGICHQYQVDMTLKSMMATAAGHYAGGLYQNGVVDTQTPIYGTFSVVDDDGFVPTEQGAVAELLDLLSYDPSGDPNEIATHFAAVPGQACARCHLWSRGKGYRGAENAEGVYRADGCAACHMLYANDGLSRSADPLIDHTETGHPMYHTVTREIPTDQCLHCHHRGARIGLTFTGRGQMPPRLPSGPGIAGTTDERFNSNFHYTDPETNPQDIHGERGLHCIDCHTKTEVMGDGNLWGHMDQATKIECRTCHGLPGSLATLNDNDGDPLSNVLHMLDGTTVLTSKVDGVEHVVPRVMDIVNPDSDRYSPHAACAMNGDHIKDEGGLECYACHTYWTPNCFGCHFERDERFIGVNLVTRQEEVGRVRTNNKVFASFKNFFYGPNAEGKYAPYIVSCHPIADVTAPDGSKILDFAMPSTTNGKSGLGHNPVQPHAVRGHGQVRTCAECHRAPSSLGLGTGSYALARDFAFTASEDGVRVYDRRTDPENPAIVGTLPTGMPLAMATYPDIIEGTSNWLFVAAGTQGLFAYNMQGPFPIPPALQLADTNAIDVARAARYLYVAVEGVGVNIYDNEDPATATLVATVPIPSVRHIVPWGIHLFVAAGPAGVVVVDISDHSAPVIAGGYAGINAADIHLYAHMQKTRHFAARAYVSDPNTGVHVLDLLPEFAAPVAVGLLPLPGARGMDTYTAYVAAQDDVPSREHDYLYVAAGSNGLAIYDITEPDDIQTIAMLNELAGAAVHVDVASEMAPPGVDDYALVAAGKAGVHLIDVTDPASPVFLQTIQAASTTRVLVEVQQMDRFMDEQGNQLKENSHPGITVMNRADIVRILSTDISAPCAQDSDFDGDSDTDLIDMAHFVACMDGPNVSAGLGCAPGDADDDGDVDFGDFAAFQLAASAMSNAPSPSAPEPIAWAK